MSSSGSSFRIFLVAEAADGVEGEVDGARAGPHVDVAFLAVSHAVVDHVRERLLGVEVDDVLLVPPHEVKGGALVFIRPLQQIPQQHPARREFTHSVI